MTERVIRIGTRGSKLALYQAYRVRDELQEKFPDLSFSIEIIKTKGDKILDVALSKIGDKGLFTKEIEQALFDNEIDMAVHSLKDLPTLFPNGAKLGAVLKRGEVRDALVNLDGRKIENLTSNDVIATSSLRRKAQLYRINKNFNIVEIRGNVNTRIRKMEEGYCNAMIMAAAGLERLEMSQYITEYLQPEDIIPACSQGAIAIEIRENDAMIEALVSAINDRETYLSTEAERAFLRTLEGGCQIPVGSHTKIDGDRFTITGFISSIDGSEFLKDSAEGDLSQAVYLSMKLAKSLYDRGGKEILRKIREENLLKSPADLPLSDKVIVSTRGAEAGDTLPDLLSDQGARVLSLPMIEIKPAELEEKTIAVVSDLKSFDWIFFTSKNGVANFFQLLIAIQGNTNLPQNLMIAAIGYKTALELDYYGYAPNFISAGNSSDDMVNQFLETYPQKHRIVLALGNLADDSLEGHLSKNNEVERIDVYQTVKPEAADPEILNLIKNNLYDLIIFTSPSTFHNFCSFYGRQGIENLKIASIGSTTSKAIKETGIDPLLTAKKSNAEGLRDEIIEYYSSNLNRD